MTCIVGLVSDDKVYIGGDSVAADSWTSTAIRGRKVFRVGEFLLGYTSSFRMGQLLQYQLDIPAQREDEGDDHYLMVTFCEAVRECLKSHGFTKIESNQESIGEFLIGYRHRLFLMGEDFCILEHVMKIWSVGIGCYTALGAMLAYGDTINPEARILGALQIASQLHSGGVLAPFYVEAL